MKKGIIFALAALALIVDPASAGYVYEGQWGTEGAGDGQFRDPTGVAVASGGNVYVCDSGNHRIQYFDPSGSFLGQWGRFGYLEKRGFSDPVSVAISPDGARAYVVDSSNCRVQYFKSK